MNNTITIKNHLKEKAKQMGHQVIAKKPIYVLNDVNENRSNHLEITSSRSVASLNNTYQNVV